MLPRRLLPQDEVAQDFSGESVSAVISLSAAHNTTRTRLAGLWVLATGLAVFLTLALLLATTGSLTLALALPGFLLAAIATIWLLASPTVSLLVAVVGFVFVANNEEGFQIAEIAYAAYLYATLSIWYARNAIIRRQRLVASAGDLSLALFFVLIPFTLILTGSFGGNFRVATSEIISLSMLLVYFPVKHTVVSHRHGPKLLLITVVILGVCVAVLNALNYASDLTGAQALWQISGSRVVVNDCLLLTGSLTSLTLLIYEQRKLPLFLYTIAFTLSASGLVVTQTRGFWLAFVLGFIALLILIHTRQRTRLLVASVLVSGALLGVGYILIGPFLFLVIGGLAERFASMATAVTNDLSLVNRFRESWVVLQQIGMNPLIGFGPGVSYQFYDIVHQSTHYDSFVHNGYIGLWYKYGIVGLGLVLWFWISAIKQGIGAFRIENADQWTRLAGLAGALPLMGITVSTLTQNPFFLKNYVFIIAVCAGLAVGAWQRPKPAHSKTRGQ